MAATKNSSLLLIFNPQQKQQLLIADFLQKKGWVEPNQPKINIHYVNQDKAGVKIKSVRQLISHSAYKPYNKQKQIFIILQAEKSSPSAQNALLKIIEEPPPETQIILTSTQPRQLLPTILSRCRKIYLNTDTKRRTKDLHKDTAAVAVQICSPKFNHAQAVKLAEKYKKREEASALILSLITYLHQQLSNSQTDSTLSSSDSKKSITAAASAAKNKNKTIKINHHNLPKILNSLLRCYQDLQKNINVRLALEHCFFKII